MKQLTFSIGQGKTSDGRTLTFSASTVSEAQKYLARYGGFTWMQALGGWVDEKGLLVFEPSVIASVIDAADGSTAQGTARYLARLFNQTSVLVTVSPIEYLEYVSQEADPAFDLPNLSAENKAESKYESSVNFESFELPENPRIN